MILTDTNVISEVMKVSPSLRVIEWLNNQDSNALYVSTITIGEIEYGLRILPDVRRRLELKERFERFISVALCATNPSLRRARGPVLWSVMGLQRELGCPISVPDGQIAGIARYRGLSIATRNTSDFEECGVDLINPFTT